MHACDTKWKEVSLSLTCVLQPSSPRPSTDDFWLFSCSSGLSICCCLYVGDYPIWEFSANSTAPSLIHWFKLFLEITIWIHIFGVGAVSVEYCPVVAFLLVLGWERGYCWSWWRWCFGQAQYILREGPHLLEMVLLFCDWYSVSDCFGMGWVKKSLSLGFLSRWAV